MEHAQRAPTASYSKMTQQQRLNPYFNGTCSKRYNNSNLHNSVKVLILILMEHAQRESERNGEIRNYFKVLILILMEHAQRGM